MASVKAREKRHALVKKGAWENSLPEWRAGMDFRMYALKLTNAMSEVDAPIRQKFVIAHWTAEGKDTKDFLKVSPFYFYSAAAVLVLKNKDIPLPKSYVKKLADAYHEVKRRVPVENPDDKPKKTVSVRDHVVEAAKRIAAEIDASIDNYCFVTGETFDPKRYLESAQASAPVCKIIADYYRNLAIELKTVKGGKDEQLVEGYSNFTTRGLNGMIKMVDAIIASADQLAAIAKATRKPRARKEKPAGVVASKVKYLKEFPDLGIKSVSPDKVVGANQVWVFNTKYRKLFKYEALPGMTLTWKGTTLQNFDPSKSGAKTIRKPELFMGEASSTTKRRLERMFDEIRGVLAKATGRINEEVIIVKVF